MRFFGLVTLSEVKRWQNGGRNSSASCLSILGHRVAQVSLADLGVAPHCRCDALVASQLLDHGGWHVAHQGPRNPSPAQIVDRDWRDTGVLNHALPLLAQIRSIGVGREWTANRGRLVLRYTCYEENRSGKGAMWCHAQA